jgi:hypothetical protein
MEFRILHADIISSNNKDEKPWKTKQKQML